MISVDEDRCTGCGVCVGVCPTGAINLVDSVARIQHGLCKRFEVCISELRDVLDNLRGELAEVLDRLDRL
jgi:Fe-S-cluster-containing hydrogenase component 2